jgi:DNA mismatch repair protein MutS2
MEKISLHLLEFNKLLEFIAGYAGSEASARGVLEILPLHDRGAIETRQGRVAEIMKMSREGNPPRLSGFQDISPLIAKSRPEGAVLEGFELASFIPVLEMAADVSLQINDRGDLPFLADLAGELTGFPDILRLLKRSVTSEGAILDTASTFLASLREEIRRLETRITKKLEEMTRDEKISVFLQDDFITRRSGRWVIPVRMDSKGQVAGVVHDVSKSGETAFIEPLVIIHLANELENLIAEQKAEEIRILRNISSKIREDANGIDAEYGVIVQLDLLNSIAKCALLLGMEIPEICDSGVISLVKARHPLLMLALRKTGLSVEVVPLDVKLGRTDTIMVITGSNAGGKTIAIKTIGLLLLMALSGMPVPADYSSRFPLADNLLVDIGDEQSIEASLSTFSAHVSNISGILGKAGPGAVVLIDELGTGTDPDEGAALACAVLKELKVRGAMVFATTHLSEIKGFVHMTDGMLNASMEFDQKTLMPLYRLRIGEPGRSHAIETARRYGLPDHVVDSARQMLGGIKVEFDDLIADLNKKRAEYEEAVNKIGKEKAALEEMKKAAEEKLAEAEAGKKRVLAEACGAAAEIVQDARRQMHILLDEIKKQERAKNREKVRAALRTADAAEKQIKEKLAQYNVDAGGPAIGEIREGDTVFVKSLGYDASVIKVSRKLNRLKVRAGGMEIELPIDDIGFGKGRSLGQKERKDAAPAFESPDEMVPSVINLVGLRVDEALSRLEPFLNHASLAGFTEVTIIHGLGTGILSRAVRQHLKGHPLVASYRAGDRAEGGNGVTVATLL